MKNNLKSFNSLAQSCNYSITLLANTASFLHQILDNINWVGFYVFIDNKLVLGPFQGKPACTEIPLGVGVCGFSAFNQETTVVDNVHNFPGHIACDSTSLSEVVIPLYRKGKLFGVLDVDSPVLSRFDNMTVEFLENVSSIICKRLNEISN